MFANKRDKQESVSGPSLLATDELIAELRVVGNKTIPTHQILSQVQTKAGRPFDPQQVQSDVRKLASLSWFVDVQPLYEQTPQGRIVIFQVVERPTIRYIEFVGNQQIRDRHLTKEVSLKVGGSVDPYAVEEGRRRILAYYRTNGFSNPQVTILEGNQPTDQGVIYVINEGVAQRVWKVEFVGNEFVSAGRLKTQIETKRPVMYMFKGYVDRDQIDADTRRLTDYYRAFGFFQAKVGRKLEFNEKGNWLTLTFVVQEGPQYEVRNVSIMGNKLFGEESLRSGMDLDSGKSFEQRMMNKDVSWIKDVYGSQGFIFADVNAEPIFLEEPGKIDLVYHVEEGRRWRVGRVFVHIDGDTPHTRIQTALNRITLHPGEIVDVREVRASERRLQASSLFLSDPMQNVTPKITYKVRDQQDTQLGSNESFRGQSPDEFIPVGVDENHRKVYEVRKVGAEAVSDEAVDIHLQFDSTTSPTAEPLPPTKSASGSAYGNLVVRTQSPYQPPTNPAPAGAANAYYQQAQPAEGYGGQRVGATGPDSAPAGHGQQNVQQVQYEYTDPLAPSNGPYNLPPPIVGPPLLAPDPGVTPIPGGAPMYPMGPMYPTGDPAVDLYVDLAENQTGRFMVGAGINSDAGVVGQILLDERNFDWTRFPTSWNDLTSGRAFRGDGQGFRIEAAPGTEVQRYLVSFQEPYLWDSPISFGLSGSFFDRRYEDWDEQRLGGRTTLGYQWTANDFSAAIAYRGESVKISDISAPIPDLTEVLGDNALHGFSLRLANDTRDNPFLATNGHFLELTIEEVIGSFQYPRIIFDGRRYFLIRERADHSGRHVVSASTRLGFTGDDTPIYDRFYAGGFTSLRGFDFRGVGPVDGFVNVGGDFMWVNTIEYLFPLTADDMMHGVVFCDFGTVESNVTINDLRISPGFGLRITIPAMGPAPIALDFAWPIHRADTDETQVFSFFVGLQR